MTLSDDELKLIAYSVGALGFGVYYFNKGFRTLHLKRLIENTPTSKIRSLAMGLVEVSGTVTKPHTELLTAPFTQRPCVHYAYEVEEYRRSKNSSRWHTIGSGRDERKFYLADDTGEVLVDPVGSDTELPQGRHQYEVSGLGELASHVKDFLQNFGVISTGLWGTLTGGVRRLRLTEHIIAPHDTLFLLGTAGDNPYLAEGTAVSGHADIMIGRGPKRSVYFIADNGEKNVLGRKRWSAPLQIFGGSLLLLGGLGFLLYELGAFGSLF